MFLHLKQDLRAEAVPWVNCPSHLKVSDFAPVRDTGHDATSFGIATSVQRQLSAIRTDLDSFNDIEAYALMASGYRMAEGQLGGQTPCVAGFTQKMAQGNWRFLKVEPALRPEAVGAEATSERNRRYVAGLLDTAASLAFKVWQLSPVLVVVRWLLAAAVVAGAAWLFYNRWERPILPSDVAATTFANVAGFLLITAATALLAFVLNRIFGRRLGSGVMKTIRWQDTLRSVVIGVGMAAGGFIVARLHLHIFDKWYLRYGQLDRLDPPARR